MKRQLTLPFVIATLLLTAHIHAQRVSDAEVQYNAALRKQLVEGDLGGAIKMYQDLIAKPTDRAVKAKALWQLAIVMEAQGRQAEAERLYQQHAFALFTLLIGILFVALLIVDLPALHWLLQRVFVTTQI